MKITDRIFIFSLDKDNSGQFLAYLSGYLNDDSETAKKIVEAIETWEGIFKNVQNQD